MIYNRVNCIEECVMQRSVDLLSSSQLLYGIVGSVWALVCIYSTLYIVLYTINSCSKGEYTWFSQVDGCGCDDKGLKTEWKSWIFIFCTIVYYQFRLARALDDTPYHHFRTLCMCVCVYSTIQHRLDYSLAGCMEISFSAASNEE